MSDTTEKAMINLDDVEIYRRLDPQGMLKHIHYFPEMCRQAWQIGLNCKLPEKYKQVKKIVILGMGGSAIGGDLVASLAVDKATVPVLVCRDYFLPQYVDGDTLVIASSYSGMTEETISAFEQSFDTLAFKLAITTGGRLTDICESQNVPVISFSYKAQPRAALPYSFFILLGVLNNLGILPQPKNDVEEAFAVLDKLDLALSENVAVAQNPAKSLAQKLLDRLPIIYGGGITAEVARRWKGQINENSKVTCFYEVFSELNHNAIMGYRFPQDVLSNAMVVMLSSAWQHERVRLRYNITSELLDKAGIYYQVVKGEGNSALAQMLSLILFGDYVSFYLAMLNEADPTEIKNIEYLKATLAKESI
jgi:glucose/mannose-6-phosphate isomerase